MTAQKIESENNIELLLQGSTSLNDDCYPHLRIAFDIGSSTTKAKAAVFCGDKKTQDLGGNYELMPYQKYLDSNNNQLSDDMKNEGLEKIMLSICYFKNLYPEVLDVKIAGIATAWARRASNSEEFFDFLEKYSINVDAISQKLEGEIGYKAAISLMGDTVKNIDDIVVCDIGGGSFQIAFDESSDTKVYHGKFGSANFFDSVKKTLGHQSEYDQARYLDIREVELAKNLAAINIEKSLESHRKTYLGDKEINVSGIGQFLNKGISQLLDGDCVRLEKLQDLMYEFCDLTADEALAMYPTMKKDYVYMTQTNLILLESLMKGLGVKQINLLDAKSTDYILNNGEIWQDYDPIQMELVAEDGGCMDLISAIA